MKKWYSWIIEDLEKEWCKRLLDATTCSAWFGKPDPILHVAFPVAAQCTWEMASYCA